MPNSQLAWGRVSELGNQQVLPQDVNLVLTTCLSRNDVSQLHSHDG